MLTDWRMIMTDKCPNCGRFVENDADGFYTREYPDSESSYTVVCCNEYCANEYERKYFNKVNISFAS